MTQPLYSYLKDSYLHRLSTRVSSVDHRSSPPFVVLQDTVFYPEGGGQPADRGRLGNARVIDVQKVDGEIRHFVDGELPEPGQRVELHLDWSRRFDHMQQHSGQHLLTATADRLFGWATTSFHLSADVCDIELDTPSISADQMRRLEEAVSDVIRDDHTITTRLLEPNQLADLGIRSRGLPAGHEGQVRVIDINRIDECACGGTHLRSTCELEAVKLLDTESIRGGTRLFWIAGRRVLGRMQEHEQRNRRLREILGTSDDELTTVAELKVEQQKDARRRLKALEQRWALATAEALASRPGPWVEAHFDDTGAGPLGQIARSIVSRAPELAVFLTATDDKGSFFVVAAGEASAIDIAEIGKAVADALDGRGGGKGKLFQGRAGSLGRRRQQAVDVLTTPSVAG